jgi:hypothetical protein
MKIRALVVAVSLAFCASIAVAAETAAPPPAGQPDMSKIGPWSRKPTNEKATKKEIADYFKKMHALEKKNDQDGMLALIDFPVYMGTDDSKGVPSAEAWDKDRYLATMKPFWDNMPKDQKLTEKLTTTVLSDSLVDVVDDFTMTTGKHKLTGRNQTLFVKRDGQWKSKVMVEAGWGDMHPTAPAATAEPAKPADTAAAAPAPK